MANLKLLQEALDAHANGDHKVANQKMRKYFVETAQEINKKLEEEMDVEEEEVEEVCEDIDTNPQTDFQDEVEYELEEGIFDGSESGQFSPEGHGRMEEGADEDFGGEYGAEEEVESDVDFSVEDGKPSGDGWEDFKEAFEDLERFFDELNGEGEEVSDELEVDVSDSGDEGDAEEEEEVSEFGDVEFGSDRVGEAYQMKKVTAPSNTAEKSKSPVAGNAKSPIEGVKPVKINDGSVKITGVGEKGGDAETYKTDDNNNVMDNAKSLMKPAKAPKNTAEKSASPLPKKAPKF